MNPIAEVITWLQTMLAQVPELVQPLIIALAGAIPFVEGELASTLGVWAGLNPFVAFFAAAIGNFLCVLGVVVVSSRAREAVVARRARNASATVDASGAGGVAVLEEVELDEFSAKPESKGRKRFKKFLVRFGVPGASILGPLALPTQFTSAMLVASGVNKGWVLLWQAVAIVLWTGLTTAIATGVLALVLH